MPLHVTTFRPMVQDQPSKVLMYQVDEAGRAAEKNTPTASDWPLLVATQLRPSKSPGWAVVENAEAPRLKLAGVGVAVGVGDCACAEVTNTIETIAPVSAVVSLFM